LMFGIRYREIQAINRPIQIATETEIKTADLTILLTDRGKTVNRERIL